MTKRELLIVSVGKMSEEEVGNLYDYLVEVGLLIGAPTLPSDESDDFSERLKDFLDTVLPSIRDHIKLWIRLFSICKTLSYLLQLYGKIKYDLFCIKKEYYEEISYPMRFAVYV